MLKMTNMYMIQHLYNSKTKKHCQCSKSLVTHGSILRNETWEYVLTREHSSER